MQDRNKKNKGFIALMSVIFISAILLLISVTLSTSSFYERYSILSSELKERSLGNAEACAVEGLLKIANNDLHLSTTTTIINATDRCSLGPINPSLNPRIFYAFASTSNYFTNIKISVDPVTLLVNSWEEIATY